MKKWIKIIFCVLIVGIITSLNYEPDVQDIASSKEFTTNCSKIRVVVDDDHPPYSFKDGNGKLQGILVDQWMLWGKKTGVEVDLDALPWNDALAAMNDGKYDVMDTICKNYQSSKLYDFSNPHEKISILIFFQGNISGIDGVESLTNFNVAVKKDSFAMDYLKKCGVNNLTVYNSHEDMIDAAKKNKAPIFVMDMAAARYFMQAEKNPNIFNHSKPLYAGEFHRAVKKGNSQMLNTVENGFSLISQDECRKIKSKWFGTTIISTKFLQNLERASMIASIVLLVLIAITFALKKKVKRKTRQLVAVTDKLDESEEKFKNLAEMALVSIMIHQDNLWVYTNPAGEKLFGYPSQELYELNFWDVIDPEFHPLVIERGQRRQSGETVPTGYEFRIITKTGAQKWVYANSGRITFNGRPAVMVSLSDISELKHRQKEISYLSYHDQLTGLYNRRFYEKELKRLDSEENLPLTIVMADVNGLKLINDSFGHSTGDELLKKVSAVLTEGCGGSGTVARLGGDEFIILLPGASTCETEQMVKRIKDLASMEKVKSIDISISFGYESKRCMEDDVQKIFKKAEDYMYKEKLSGSQSVRGKAIKAIITTLHEKNKREEQHSCRVSALCRCMGEALDLPAWKIEELETVGLLHDIGKIAVDENILNKPSKLTADEWDHIRRHPEVGYRILNASNDMSDIAQCVLHHHERWDGSGYPRGLAKEEIPYLSRIIAIVDAYDAMTSERSYRNALPEEVAIGELRKNTGIQFDPELTKIFIEKVLHIN